MPITTGTVLGRYRLLEKAGVGGMSEVWKAEDGTLKRTVAVKVILGPVAADPTFRERFLREARLVAGLEHPNVLPVFDYGTATIDGDDVSYLVMPLVAGGSLKGRVAGPVPPALAVTWLSAIASALDHAHARGLLHRDVKPGNVLMDSQGRLLLADFGLARSFDVSSGLTATGTVLGTPLYMAPEQATGSALDGRADQYALAVIAFELLAGRVLFSADSPLGVLHQHVAAPPPLLSSVLPGTAPAVDAVLARGLAKKTADRFASCGEFVAALGAALALPMTAATAPVTARGESQLATVVSAPALGIEALAAPASVKGTPPDSSRRVMFILAALLLLSAGGGIILLLRPGSPTSAPSVAGAPASSEIASRVKDPEPTAAPVLTTSAESTASSGISSKVDEASATGTASAATEPRPNSPLEENDAATRGAAGNSKRAGGAHGSSPFEEKRPRQTTGSAPKADGLARASRPKQYPLPPLLSGAAHSGDTQLGPAWDALDNARRPGGRLARENFVDAMGAARAVLARRPTAEARFLDAFSRAGVAFADGRDAEAWQLLTRALDGAGPAADSHTLRFVEDEVRALGPNPGPDASWVMGLAFADVRSDLADELVKAEERAPRSPRVREARALAGGR
jgi:serine/threonine-protein kinase